MSDADNRDGGPDFRFSVDTAANGYTTGRRPTLRIGGEQPPSLFQLGRVKDAVALAEAQFSPRELPTGPFPGAFEALLERFPKGESERGEMGPRHIAATILYRAAELREIEDPIRASGRDEVPAFAVLQLSRIGFEIGSLFTELRWKLAHEANAQRGAAVAAGSSKGAAKSEADAIERARVTLALFAETRDRLARDFARQGVRRAVTLARIAKELAETQRPAKSAAAWRKAHERARAVLGE